MMPAGRRALLGTSLAMAAVARSNAAGYPDRPLRMLLGYPAGGGTDIMARAVAQRMQAELGQPLVIENRGGAAGMVAAQAAVSAPPDGYTLLFVTGSEVTLRPLLDRGLPFDMDRDLVPVVLLGTTPVVLAVNAALPARDVAELVALAKAQPGRLSYASTGTGGMMHLTGELFRVRAGVDILHVPYRGAAPAVNDTAGGQVQMIFNGLPPVLPLARDGRLRILAVSTPRRTEAAPEVPTLEESGLPGFDTSNTVGLVAPRGTPPEAVARVNAAANTALADPAVREIFRRNGADALGSTPEGYAEYIRAERARFAEVIRLTGVRLD
jgi:tripartite-type tricarboxylate transporter receptor subunit TctC